MDILQEKTEIRKMLKKSKNIFIMAHKNLDLDALGSSIGMAIIAKKFKNNIFLIIDDKQHELGVEKVLHEQEGCFNILKSKDVSNKLYEINHKNLLIILDTNKEELLQSSEVLKYFKNILIIDHHEIDKKSLKKGKIIVDNEVSSTCEMITSLVEKWKIKLEPYYATLLLSGIVLDTSNFTLKTTSETFYKAYYLSCLGASSKKVQYLLKQDLGEYKERQKLFTNIEVMNKIAITKGTNYTEYRREDLAKVADTLLFFNNVEASFVIGKLSEKSVGISARSMGNYDIVKVLEKLNGGGNETTGAAKIENKTIGKVEEELKKILKKQKEEE